MLQSNYGNILIAYAVYINISIVKFHKKKHVEFLFFEKNCTWWRYGCGNGPEPGELSASKKRQNERFLKESDEDMEKTRCKVLMENVPKKNRCIKNTSNFRSSKHENMISMISVCWFVRFTHFTLEIEVEVQRVVRSLMCLFSIPSFQYKAHRMDGPARLAHLSHLSCNHL